MGSLITIFHIDWKIIIAQVINFAVVFLVLYLFALKPLTKLMSEREGKIKKGVTDANANALMLEKTQKEYAEVLNKAKAEAHEFFMQGKREAEAKKAEMLETAKAEVASLILNGQKSLEAEKVKIVGEAKKDIASLVIKATEKVLTEKGGLTNIL